VCYAPRDQLSRVLLGITFARRPGPRVRTELILSAMWTPSVSAMAAISPKKSQSIFQLSWTMHRNQLADLANPQSRTAKPYRSRKYSSHAAVRNSDAFVGARCRLRMLNRRTTIAFGSSQSAARSRRLERCRALWVRVSMTRSFRGGLSEGEEGCLANFSFGSAAANPTFELMIEH